MKRHVRDNKGRLLQLDKKWKNLRVGQKEWISNELRTCYKEDAFSEQILADLTAQGYSGDELLTAFEETAAQVRPAVKAMLEEAERASVQPDKYASYADVFSPEDEG